MPTIKPSLISMSGHQATAVPGSHQCRNGPKTVIRPNDNAESAYFGRREVRGMCDSDQGAVQKKSGPANGAWAAEKDESSLPRLDATECGGAAEADLAYLFVRIVAAGAFHRVGAFRHRRLAAARLRHFLASTMACHAAFAAGLTGFFAGPLVRRALLVR